MSLGRDRRRLARAFRRPLHRDGDLIQGRRRLLQRSGLLFGAARQVIRGLADFVGAAAQRGHRRQHLPQRRAQAGDGAVEVRLHRLVGAFHLLLDGRQEIAVREAGKLFSQGADKASLRRLGRQAGLLRPLRGLFGLGDVDRQLDHLQRPTGFVQHGIVGGFEPDLAPALGDAAELAGDEAALVQFTPEGAVVGRRRLIGVHEHPVMPSLNLVQGVAHGLKQIVVGAENRPVQIEFDHGLGPPDRRHQAVQFLKPLQIRSLFSPTISAEHPTRSPSDCGDDPRHV
ncbi:hypothetical protein D3C73_1050810 [compost metagenome]